MVEYKTLKILFAEDHEMVRHGIKLMLGQQHKFKAVIDEAMDGAEALFKAFNEHYDVILLDINLPKKNGIDVTKFLVQKLKDPRILILSMHNESYIIKSALDAGATGYILKNSGVEELTKAILTVYEGNHYYCNEVSQAMLGNKSQQKKSLQTTHLINLKKEITKRESDVLKLIIKGYTDKEIAVKLKISDRTVGNHRNHLIKKFDLKNSTELAVFAVKYELI